MSCKRTRASAFLTVALLISLLALDRPIAHARHVKDSSTSTGAGSSSMKKGLEGTRKLDVGKTKSTENVEEVSKAPRGKGGRSSFGWNLGHGGSLGAKFAKVVVVLDHSGPKPHPPKHN